MDLVAGLAATVAVALATQTVAAARSELRIPHARSTGASKEAFDKIVAGIQAANPGVTVNRIVFDDDICSDTGLITQPQRNELPEIGFQRVGFPVQRDVKAGCAANLTTAMADVWQPGFIDSAFGPGSGTRGAGASAWIPSRSM